MTRDWRLTTLALAALIIPCRDASAALTEAPRLAALYDIILSARFDEVDAALMRACPPAPAEACASLGAVAVWWRILISPESRALDRSLNEAAAAAIATNAAWTRREPQRGEAWFYLAGSYAPLVQWRVLRSQRLAAAREGKKIKDALERALRLDPTLADAYFGIGAYHYYAAVAPVAAKILRWLLFLPGGDRERGLQEMLQARERGQLLQGEADFQLHLAYLWYEQKPAAALKLLEQLDARYPTNPLFRERIADVFSVYFSDHAASADAWRNLLVRARAGRVYAASAAEARALRGLAAEQSALERKAKR